MNVSPAIRGLADDVQRAGGRALLVGGGVRDALLGREAKDQDVEVYGLPSDELASLLRRTGKVDEVGRSFGVFKWTPPGEDTIDVSLPRTDSKLGPGHRGIAVHGDPFLDVVEASRRRDLTINAIMVDLHTHEIIDPHGGLADLEAGVLRAVDLQTFLEDPLRALRVAQFAARLEFSVDPALLALCLTARVDELPPERILVEWQKLFLGGRKPSLGIQFARHSGLLSTLFPTLVDRVDNDAVLDAAAQSPQRDSHDGWHLALLLSLWVADSPQWEDTMDALGLHRRLGLNVRRLVGQCLQARMEPWHDDAALRHLSVKVPLRLMLAFHRSQGASTRLAWQRSETLGILEQGPTPIVQGRDLRRLGHAPGPALGDMLQTLYTMQLDGTVRTRDEGLEAARALLKHPS